MSRREAWQKGEQGRSDTSRCSQKLCFLRWLPLPSAHTYNSRELTSDPRSSSSHTGIRSSFREFSILSCSCLDVIPSRRVSHETRDKRRGREEKLLHANFSLAKPPAQGAITAEKLRLGSSTLGYSGVEIVTLAACGNFKCSTLGNSNRSRKNVIMQRAVCPLVGAQKNP